MSAHTPGPWEALPIRADARGFRVREIHHRSESVSGGVHVEVHELGAVGGLARLDADARLIAAAPDLLEALKAVVEQFVGIDHHRDECPGLLAHDGVTVLGPVCRDHQVAALVDAAIAKAEGKR